MTYATGNNDGRNKKSTTPIMLQRLYLPFVKGNVSTKVYATNAVVSFARIYDDMETEKLQEF